MVKVFVAEPPVESAIFIVKLEFTCAVGVPEMVTDLPVIDASASPGVREPPGIDQVNGGRPPAAVTVAV
jgi:hypothetical protein